MPNSRHIVAVIPARYASQRFPGKMLADLGGKPLIVRTWENARRCASPHEVLVATDDERIAAVIRAAGGEAVMTDPELPSGTDRIHAALAKRNADVVVNIQGDEPMLPPGVIDTTVQALLDHPDADVATAATALPEEGYHNPNAVKVVCDDAGRALYFSRAAIPFDRDGGFPAELAALHLGLYVYRREVLTRVCALPPSPLEQVERLEQLRMLADGMRIQVHHVDEAGPGGVDTRDDLKRVNQLLV